MAAAGPTSSGPANRAAIARVSIDRARTAPDWNVRIAGNRCQVWTVRRRVRGRMIVGDRISAVNPAWIGLESLPVWDGQTLAVMSIVVGFQA